MSKKENLTAWEVLRETYSAIDEILVSTAAGTPDEETTEKIQQALIIAMGAISIFSQHLADDDIHGIVGKEAADDEGK